MSDGDDRLRDPAHIPWTPANAGCLLVLGGAITLCGLAIMTPLPGLLLCGVVVAALIYVVSSTTIQLGLLDRSKLIICLSVLLIVAGPIILAIKGIRAAETNASQEVDRIMAVHEGQDMNFLRTAADGALSMAADLGSKPAQMEIDRRQQDTLAREQASAKEAEARNSVKIRAALKELDGLIPQQDLERLEVYKRLIRLAPANPTYQKSAEKIEADLADKQNRIDHPEANIDIVRSSWRKGGFDNIFIFTGTLKNTGTRPWKDFVVLCQLRAASGTVVQTVRGTIYERLDAGQKRTFRNVNFGYLHNASATSDCRVSSASPD